MLPHLAVVVELEGRLIVVCFQLVKHNTPQACVIPDFFFLIFTVFSNFLSLTDWIWSVFVSPGSHGIHIRSLLYVDTYLFHSETEMKIKRKWISYSYPLAVFVKVTEASSKMSSFRELFDASMSQQEEKEKKTISEINHLKFAVSFSGTPLASRFC